MSETKPGLVWRKGHAAASVLKLEIYIKQTAGSREHGAEFVWEVHDGANADASAALCRGSTGSLETAQAKAHQAAIDVLLDLKPERREPVAPVKLTHDEFIADPDGALRMAELGDVLLTDGSGKVVALIGFSR